MTIVDRLTRIPAWVLFILFGVGLVIIGLSAAPISQLIGPHAESKIAARQPHGQPQTGKQSAKQEPGIESSSDAVLFLTQEWSTSRTRLGTAEDKLKQAVHSGDQQAIEQARQEYVAAKRQYDDLQEKVNFFHLETSLTREALNNHCT
jgi:hypothetical protein